MTEQEIARTISRHRGGELRRLEGLWQKYQGQHGILEKRWSDPTRPCNRLMYNFPRYIADNYASYMVGNQIAYKSNNGDAMRRIAGILSYNDSGFEDNRIALDLCVCGAAFEIHYLDQDGMERFVRAEPWEMIPVFDNTLEGNLRCVIRCYTVVEGEEKKFLADVYDAREIVHYRGGEGFLGLVETGRERHYYGDVPVVAYLDRSSFEDVTSLVEAYEKLSSAEVDDYEAFVDAMLVLKGAVVTSEKDENGDDDLALMKKNRVLLLDPDSDASYLTKEVNSSQIENIKAELVENIHKLSGCPNFADEAFGTSSGIAMAYKLLGFTNAGKKRIRAMKKGLQRRLELLCNILDKRGMRIDYRDIEVVFTPSLPVDNAAAVQTIAQLRGLVSDETLIAQLPFVEDVAAELARVAAQNANTYEITPGGEEG